MKAVTKILGVGVAAAALGYAAPAAAQYYPGYGYNYGYNNGGNVVGQVLNQVLGNGYGNYGVNSQTAVNQCAAAVQQRLGGGYGGYGYNQYNSGGGRVLGISRVEQRTGGGLTVRGVATSGRYGNYGYGNNGQAPVDLTWKCKTDYRGFVSDVNINAAQGNYRYGNNYNYNYSPYGNNDYSQYGYRRY
jgi:hypothetical protein